MIKIECYRVKTGRCGEDYFNGGYGPAIEYRVEHFYNKEEAEKACEEIKNRMAKAMAWCDWWVEKYINEEHFKVEKVVVEF